MTELKCYLKDSRNIIDRALNKYLPPAGKEPKIIHEAMRYSVFPGGKRIRPIIVLEACRVCGGRPDDAMVIACAVEMVHAYSLAHDDLPSMDDDDYRRGNPTSHKVFGEAIAILAGDALLTLAFNIISKHLDSKRGIKAIKNLSEAIGTYGMVGGQAMDICAKGRVTPARAQDHINKLKTARLFEASAVLGAIASGASDKEIKAMAAFGESIGEAFQIVDDIMDSKGRAGSPGRRKLKLRAEASTDKAKDALKIFDKRANRLKEIADHMVNRIA